MGARARASDVTTHLSRIIAQVISQLDRLICLKPQVVFEQIQLGSFKWPASSVFALETRSSLGRPNSLEHLLGTSKRAFNWDQPDLFVHTYLWSRQSQDVSLLSLVSVTYGRRSGHKTIIIRLVKAINHTCIHCATSERNLCGSLPIQISESERLKSTQANWRLTPTLLLSSQKSPARSQRLTLASKFHAKIQSPIYQASGSCNINTIWKLFSMHQLLWWSHNAKPLFVVKCRLRSLSLNSSSISNNNNNNNKCVWMNICRIKISCLRRFRSLECKIGH